MILLLGFKTPSGALKLDPVRIQKGMFLLAQEGEMDESEKYEFEPLHYGPYSRELRRELGSLVAEGLVDKEPVPGYTWSRYQLTTAGFGRGRELLDNAPRTELKRLFGIKSEITSVSFRELLDDVYTRYPEFAERSIFQK